MARVKEDVKMAVTKMIDQLPDEILSTCGLCNRTLFDELTQIRVKSGAPQMTVCDIFANRYNLTKREEDHVSPKAFRDLMQYLARVNAKDLSAESQQIMEKNIITPEKDEPVDGESEERDTHSESDQSEEQHTAVDPKSVSTSSSVQDPYDVLVELWRTQQYTAEDVYEVFLAELLGRFSPEDVDQYRRDAGVTLDELSLLIGNTARQNTGLSPEDFHHTIRNGLEIYGGWSQMRVDKALGSAPLTSAQLAAGDF